MKKLLLALTAAAAFSGSAFAADLPARTYTKAPPPVVAPSWTGFYIFGGVGGGIWDADTYTSVTATGVPLSIHQTPGWRWLVRHRRRRLRLAGQLDLGGWRVRRWSVRQHARHDPGSGRWLVRPHQDGRRLGCWRARRLPRRSERALLRGRW